MAGVGDMTLSRRLCRPTAVASDCGRSETASREWVCEGGVTHRMAVVRSSEPEEA